MLGLGHFEGPSSCSEHFKKWPGPLDHLIGEEEMEEISTLAGFWGEAARGGNSLSLEVET